MPKLSYAEARDAVQRLGISTIIQYRARYRETPGLPSSPPEVYRDDWTGWTAFLAPHAPKFLALLDAMRAVQPLGIHGQQEYRRRYREAPGLPSNPEMIYGELWPGWSVFLGKSSEKLTRRRRLNLAEAQQRAHELNLKTVHAYRQAVKGDDLLPRDPECLLGWPGWGAFLGTLTPLERWLPYETARALVQSLGWSDVRTYRTSYHEHAGLPQSPDLVYVKWISWTAFLAPRPARHLPYAEARRVACAAGFRTFREYAAGYRVHPGLPSTPNKTYKAEWAGWAAFLKGVSTPQHEGEYL
ncbi:integrase repeat-containing protein [Deinococcus yunweiensis]|uniref:integrase repeat-containing protein n=1 Tax=Deinococcus yunweiensis TaxID=367282 RepID=UPI00398E8C2C